PKHFTSQQVEEGLYIDNFTPYRLTFSAYSDTETIFITLYDMLSLTERNYNGYTVTQTDTNVIISGPTIGYQTNNLNYSTVLDSNYPDVALELTEITSNTMKGRFSGILKRNGTPDIVITEGEFVIPYKTNPN
ncbi:MAG TPA: hypothetical protein PKI08_09990, partial [Aquaticitalea sp.]|nr:hypothetical protein [Aquaticitalea sp.]